MEEGIAEGKGNDSYRNELKVCGGSMKGDRRHALEDSNEEVDEEDVAHNEVDGHDGRNDPSARHAAEL